MKDVVNRVQIMKDVSFISCDYTELDYGTSHNIVYCDPPYQRRSRYYDEFNRQLSFDSDKFWLFFKRTSESNIVIISEHVDFFDKRKDDYNGNYRLIKLPSHTNRFGKTTRDSGEYVFIMTKLKIDLEGIEIKSNIYIS